MNRSTNGGSGIPEATVTRARRLRRAQTVPERLIWHELRNRRLNGLKFKRQHPIGPYFADFFCEEARLVVELDGVTHEWTPARDRVRDDFLKASGIETLRIANDHVLRNLPDVIHVIAQTALLIVGKRSQSDGNGFRDFRSDPSP